VLPRSRRVTGRVIAFIVVLFVLLAGAVGAHAWYARSSYFVGVDGDRVAIFKGRPDGLFWFDPTLEERTDLRLDDVPPARRDALAPGKEVADIAEARRYVTNLEEEAAALEPPPTTTTTTTVSPAPPPQTPPS
jgi:protein phosphatase